MSEPPSRVSSTRWLWIATVWCAGGLFDASQTVLIMQKEGRNVPWLPLFATEFAGWLPWALATPFIVHLVRRTPTTRGFRTRAAGVHLSAFATISVVAEAWSALLQVLFDPWVHRHPPEFLNTWSTSLLYQVLTFLIAYALIFAVTLLLDSRERISRQITEAARLNEALSRAQLATLRQQMEPHFMFNTLHAIAGLVRDRDNNAAVNMIVGLSEFLRRATEDSHRSEVSLAEELEYLQRDLDTQKMRFDDRLQLSIDLPSELLRAQVPNLLLQPLVENAIKHGIAKRISGGRVRISGAADNGILRLSVYNDGPTLPVDWQMNHTGVGIGNLRTRLQILHGNQSSLVLRRVDARGVEVIVTLPLVEA